MTSKQPISTNKMMGELILRSLVFLVLLVSSIYYLSFYLLSNEQVSCTWGAQFLSFLVSIGFIICCIIWVFGEAIWDKAVASLKELREMVPKKQGDEE